MDTNIINSTTIRMFGEWFIVTADYVDQRRDVERRCAHLWLEHRETTPADERSLISIHAKDWLGA